jgi:hypothetical protein
VVTLSKTSGLGATVSVADAGGTPRTISNDVTDFTITMPVALQDTTGVDKSAHEKLALLRDVSTQLKMVFNAAANMSHAVFSTITTTPNQRATSLYPTSSGSSPVMTFNALYSAYNLTRAAAGELTTQADGTLADGAIPTWA